ncbi:hypothetical protein [Campylobacter concisus]|uniref:hypothetical protein n=1 Tax=Campylobacter concisus TaxID=199 RepID=UPI00131A87DB|nr:hypothetical protein [Campylobacter concisus]
MQIKTLLERPAGTLQMILNLTNTKFKTSNLTIKPYKYVRIFSLQAAQSLLCI